LFEQLDAFRAAEIAVAFESAYADIVRVRDAAAVLVAVVFKVDSTLRSVLTEQIGITIPVTGRDEHFQPELLEVVRELVEKIAYLWIVAASQQRIDRQSQSVLHVGRLHWPFSGRGIDLF